MVVPRYHALEGGLVYWDIHADRQLGVTTWFSPSVDIYRSPQSPSLDEVPTIQPGDMLHVDIGITAMNMNTDTQHLGYVLRANETAPPDSLVKGLRDANKLQDMVRKEMKVGRTGDEVFWAVRRDMREKGLKGKIYSHPIGDYGHSAGAVIGMQDWQSCECDVCDWRSSNQRYLVGVKTRC